MDNYTKLYQRILQSSVWKLSSDIRVVWITILALKDAEGVVRGSAGWLADQARVTDETCEEALKIFMAPDSRSRTATNDGKKIEEIEGGWRVLNHHLYRDGIEDQRDKWARQKRSQRAKVKLRQGESLASHVRKAVEEDPITKADHVTLGAVEKRITKAAKEYDLDHQDGEPPLPDGWEPAG